MRQGSTRGRVALAAAVLCLGLSTPTRGAERDEPLPDARLGIRTVPLLLLSRPDVRADLGLSDAQTALASRAITDLYVQAAAVRGKTGAEALEMRKAVDDAQRRWIETNLSPLQRDRLVQIDLQWEGPSALVSRPVVSDTLGLTKPQREALKAAVGKWTDARARGDSAAAQEEAGKAVNVLDAAQRERYKAMLGREFTPKIASAAPATGAPRAN